MKATADAVIVGGGVMGCSVLYNLAMRGMTNTVLLEKDVLASGSTGKSQAILRMHYSNEVTTRMAWESLKVFKDFQGIVGGSSGYVRVGYLLIVDSHDRQALEDNVAMQKRVGINTDMVSAEDVEEIEPAFAVRDDEAFAYEPESGYADPYSVTTSYARRAREMGADVQMNTTVTDIQINGGRVTAVATSQGRVETPIAVVATGPWSRPFFQKLGIELPLQTVRHQVITIRRPEDQVPEHAMLADVVNSLSARPESGNLTLIGVGEGDPAEPDQYNQGVDMDVVEDAFAGLVRRMPAMSQALFRGGWSGLFTTTPDWHPILDRVEGIEGLYCAVGFSGHGFKLSPMVGAVMAELVTEGHPMSIAADLVSKLSLDRFSRGDLMTSRYSMSVLA